MISVIIVDDNDMKRTQIKMALEEFDCVIDEAENIAKAKELFHKVHYDLAIVDLALPIWKDSKINPRAGVDLLREIYEMEFYLFPKTVLAITQHEDNLEFRPELDELGVVLCHYAQDTDISSVLKPYITKSIKNRMQTSYDYDVCIIAALEKEINPFRAHIDSLAASEEFSCQDFHFQSGQLKTTATPLKIALVTLPRMGLVTSAIYTMKAITLLKPKLMIMPGICAGVKGKVNLGDLIVADPCWEWQVGKIESEKFRHETYQINLNGFSKGLVQTYSKEKLNEHWTTCSVKRPDQIPTLHIGALASGSSVISNEEKVQEIAEQHRKLLGLEMEIYSVYSACSVGWPKPNFMAVKSVCDFGDNTKHDDYQEFCAMFSSKFVIDVLQENARKISAIKAQ
ncbi:response regulator [Aeromonas caviae]